MNLTKKFAISIFAVIATFLGLSAAAMSPFQTEEFDVIQPPEYVSCLGEHVSSRAWVTIRFREFETPSGTAHYIEHWTWEIEYIGQVTGRIWFGHARSPGSFHAGKGEVGQWTSREMAVPVVGDGPKFRYNLRFKYTFNANGELKVFYQEPTHTLDDWIRCLGPGD